jgi:hypothetical protein
MKPKISTPEVVLLFKIGSVIDTNAKEVLICRGPRRSVVEAVNWKSENA